MIVFSITLQYKKLIIAVIIQAVFFSDIKKFYNISFSKPSEKEKKTLSVLSFNIKLFDLYNWQNNHLTRKNILDYLKNNPADVICLQEFYTSEDSNDFNNLSELKNIFPNYYFHFEYFVTLRKNDHWGLLTLSKYPIVKKSAVYFNNAKNNGCLYSDILFGDDTIRIFNIHLQSYNFFKKRKWKSNLPQDKDNFIQALDSTYKGKNFFQKFYYNNLLKTQQIESVLEISDVTTYPIIIAGDFNETPHSYIMKKMKDYHFIDAFTEKGNGFGFTYYDKLFVRIDYIFHNTNFVALDFMTENNSQTQHLSDHYPIRSILKLNK